MICRKLLRLGTSCKERANTSEVVQAAVEGVHQLETRFGAPDRNPHPQTGVALQRHEPVSTAREPENDRKIWSKERFLCCFFTAGGWTLQA